MHATPALLLKIRQISERNVCWITVIRKKIDITNGNQLERLLMVWGELMLGLFTQYSYIRLHSIGEFFNHLENSVLCILLCIFQWLNMLHDDCMLAVL